MRIKLLSLTHNTIAKVIFSIIIIPIVWEASVIILFSTLELRFLRLRFHHV